MRHFAAAFFLLTFFCYCHLLCCCNALAQNPIHKTNPRPVIKPVTASPQKLRPAAATAQDKLKEDVKGFVAALNGKYVSPFLTKYVWGARLGYFGADEWHRWWRREHSAYEPAVTDVKILKFSPTQAEISFSYRLYPKHTPPLNAGPFTLKLDHTAEDIEKTEPKVWQFVPRALAEDEFLKPNRMPWAIWMISQAPGSLEAYRRQVALLNLSILGESARKFEQDFNDVYAFSAEFQEEALHPYVGNDAVWTVPGTRDKYLFNNRLSGKDPANIADPARTILFYDGSEEKAKFRYNTKTEVYRTMVYLVDGRIAIVDEDGFKALLWE